MAANFCSWLRVTKFTTSRFTKLFTAAQAAQPIYTVRHVPYVCTLHYDSLLMPTSCESTLNLPGPLTQAVPLAVLVKVVMDADQRTSQVYNISIV